jgi:hypothetical protein
MIGCAAFAVLCIVALLALFAIDRTFLGTPSDTRLHRTTTPP